jgi:hypothetical protein
MDSSSVVDRDSLLRKAHLPHPLNDQTDQHHQPISFQPAHPRASRI